MKKLGVAIALLASLVLPALFAVDLLSAETSTRPPRNLKKVGDHWTPWSPPPAGPDAYVIQRGDTLWDLARKWLGDPYLWPQIWDENRYILDSHWIYPGDPLVVPGKPTVVPEGQLPTPPGEPAPSGVQPITGVVERPLPPQIVHLVPVADESDLYCSGYIEPEHVKSSTWIAGHELEHVAFAQGEIVYLSQGRNQGLRAGDDFAIIREVGRVDHPITDEALGVYIRRLGRVRVMLAHDETSTAIVEMACEDLLDGDELVPWVEIPAPALASLPPFDRYDPTPSDGEVGHVVVIQDLLTAAGAGHLIQTDLGQASGVKPGDVLTLFRDGKHGVLVGEDSRGAPSWKRTPDGSGPELPRTNLGQAVVLTVEQSTSTAKIMMSVRECSIGDRVEVER